MRGYYILPATDFILDLVENEWFMDGVSDAVYKLSRVIVIKRGLLSHVQKIVGEFLRAWSDDADFTADDLAESVEFLLQVDILAKNFVDEELYAKCDDEDQAYGLYLPRGRTFHGTKKHSKGENSMETKNYRIPTRVLNTFAEDIYRDNCAQVIWRKDAEDLPYCFLRVDCLRGFREFLKNSRDKAMVELMRLADVGGDDSTDDFIDQMMVLRAAEHMLAVVNVRHKETPQ